MTEEQTYMSGLGKKSILPPELKRWNWGAFLLSWIWGIGNSVFIALLMFVPFVNFFMPFVLGAKGNKWAWQKRTWRDVDHFKSTQKKWAIWGLLFWLFWLLLIPAILFPLFGMMKGNDAYKMSLANAQNHPEVQQLLGTPIRPGLFVSGSISTSGPDGQASLQYSLTGPLGEAENYVFAYKNMGKWIVQEQAVYLESIDKRIDIIPPRR